MTFSFSKIIDSFYFSGTIVFLLCQQGPFYHLLVGCTNPGILDPFFQQLKPPFCQHLVLSGYPKNQLTKGSIYNYFHYAGVPSRAQTKLYPDHILPSFHCTNCLLTLTSHLTVTYLGIVILESKLPLSSPIMFKYLVPKIAVIALSQFLLLTFKHCCEHLLDIHVIICPSQNGVGL